MSTRVSPNPTSSSCWRRACQYLPKDCLCSGCVWRFKSSSVLLRRRRSTVERREAVSNPSVRSWQHGATYAAKVRTRMLRRMLNEFVWYAAWTSYGRSGDWSIASFVPFAFGRSMFYESFVSISISLSFTSSGLYICSKDTFTRSSTCRKNFCSVAWKVASDPFSMAFNLPPYAFVHCGIWSSRALVRFMP